MFITEGFLRMPTGDIKTFSAPVTNGGTFPYAINNTGTITGSYSDASGAYHGFVR